MPPPKRRGIAQQEDRQGNKGMEEAADVAVLGQHAEIARGKLRVPAGAGVLEPLRRKNGNTGLRTHTQFLINHGANSALTIPMNSAKIDGPLLSTVESRRARQAQAECRSADARVVLRAESQAREDRRQDEPAARPAALGRELAPALEGERRRRDPEHDERLDIGRRRHQEHGRMRRDEDRRERRPRSSAPRAARARTPTR